MLDKDSLNNEISVGVTFASLMAAISLFFTGAVISQYSSFGPTIRVPLLLLIISTFSFIFAATIYNNAGSQVTLGKLKTVEKYMIYSKNIVEFLGLYPLILATPLVIGALTNDSYLRTSTTIVAVVSIAVYSQSKFSILDKQLTRLQKQCYSLLVVAVALLLYLAQTLRQFETVSYYSITSFLLLLFLLVPTIFFSLRSQQYRVVSIRDYKLTDRAGLSRLSQQGGRRTAKSAKHTTGMPEAAVEELAAATRVFVAVSGNRRVGFIALDDNKVRTIFTDPSMHRKGIGRMLVDAAEYAAADNGHEELSIHAAPSSVKFFKRLGYEATGDKHNSGPIMNKEL